MTTDANTTPTPRAADGPALVDELNELLKLDHDALAAYSLAAATVRSATHRATIELYRRDHERHVRELSELVRTHGGTPADRPHAASGVFKLAVQAAGAAGGTRGVMLAFKTNELKSRDAYRRAANGRHPEDVALYLARAAQDEATHHAWAMEALEALRHEPAREQESGGRGDAVGTAPERAADTIANARRTLPASVSGRVQRARERVRQAPRAKLGALALAVGVGVLTAVVVGRARRRA